MPLISLGNGDFGSVSENVPRFRLRNMYLTPNPLSPDGVSRVSRPTLTQVVTAGSGPIYGIWRQSGTLDGQFFIVSGTELYLMTTAEDTPTLVGNIPGTGFVKFAGTDNRIIIVRDGVAYSTDGVTITTVVMPDDQLVSSVACINSYFLLSVKDSQKFYWIIPGGTDPDPLDFASAERTPDFITSIEIISDEVWIIGEESVEVWIPSDDPDAPFSRVGARVYNEGCSNRATVVPVTAGNTPALIWVTNTSSVVMGQGNTATVSTPSEEELLKTATNLRAWFFRHNRHDFYILTSEEFTLALNLNDGNWSRWDTYLKPNWRAHVGGQFGTTPYAGDSTTGKIWRLEEGFDDDNEPVVRTTSGFIDNINITPVRCDSVVLRVNAGWSPSYGFIPNIELRWSDDLGASWSDPMVTPLGDKGEYSSLVVFRSLGLIRFPGRMFEVTFSERARIRIDYASLNEL